MSLFSGGRFDRSYNKRYEPAQFSVPAPTRKVAGRSFYLTPGRHLSKS